MTEDDFAEAAKYSPVWFDARATARSHLTGDALSGFIDERLAACAGIMGFWPGVGEAWAILTDVGRAHPMLVHRAIRDGLRAIMRERQYRRIQADVYRDFEVGRIWAVRLGFRKESVMRAYAPDGKDMVRYVWLR